MSKTKQFAIWLSACIFQWEFTNEEIMERFLLREDIPDSPEVEPWLKNQIEVIRKNPGRFRELMNTNQRRGY